MWPEAAASNEAGWAASVAWVKRQGLSLSHRDYHSLYWLMYVYLQQGRYKQAAELLALKQKDMAEASGHDAKGTPIGHKGEVGRYFDEMVASYVVETERSEEHTSELQSRLHLVCRLLLEKKKNHIY